MNSLKVKEIDNPIATENAAKGFWYQYEAMVNKGYLDILHESDVLAFTEDIPLEKVEENFRARKISKIVYDKREDNIDKLNSVFSSVNDTGNIAFVFLQNKGDDSVSCGSETQIYIGVKANVGARPQESASEGVKCLEGSLKGNFPGIELSEIDSDDRMRILESFEDKENRCIACLTGIPSFKNTSKNAQDFTQGIEKLIDAMGGRKFSALLLAEPISRDELQVIEHGYQDIYSQLSMMNVSAMSVSEQKGVSFGSSVADSVTETMGRSLSETNSINESRTKTVTDTVAKTVTNSTTVSAGIGGGSSIGASLSAGFGPIGVGVSRTVSKFFSLGVAKTRAVSDTTSHSESFSNTEGTSHAITEGLSVSEAKGKTLTESKSDSLMQGVSFQYDVKEKRVVEALSAVEEQLKRIRDAKNYGAWSWGAYIVAPDTATARVGASVLSGVFRGEGTGLERSSVTYWTESEDRENFNYLKTSLARLRHPIFQLHGVPVRTTSLLNTRELTVGMSLPQKSLPGLPVLETAEFGRSVEVQGGTGHHAAIDIGAVSHLGNVERGNHVLLNKESLSSHVFITGSTGSGKSNAVYQLVSKIRERDVHFLVIEPAKGEYKTVFGSDSDVRVFGTNPNLTELLRINPFSFPSQIHVMEHIDRFIEILNAVWPMYAAMPAIMKDAVERAYEKMGWDLLTSTNKYGSDIFPDFHDLLSTLPEVINSSEYDKEVKSNYSGALLTRVRSLTNGYFRTVFQKDELASSVLFDENVIIDLSRVGAAETKSLLMGVVFLKLQEHRIANASSVNSTLKHITVLEEAHNLLRKTSAMQGADGANLQGKSVEMIANAIAEMRTYGEGFIIADQAPGLLDPSVIRNTNTKIVLRLPDQDDRELVGKAENLNDDQIRELARLPTGCASVYQNNWQEAVLCQFDEFKGGGTFAFEGSSATQNTGRECARRILLAKVLGGLDERMGAHEGFDGESLLRKYYPYYVNSTGSSRQCSEIFIKEFLEPALDTIGINKDFNIWTGMLVREICAGTDAVMFSDVEREVLFHQLFVALANIKPNQKDLWMGEGAKLEKWRCW